MKAALVLGFLFVASVGSSALAADRNDLINDALNQNLQERDQVVGTYHENEAATRPTTVDMRAERIPVVMDSELSSGGTHLHNYDTHDRIYKEQHIEAHLDREVRDIHKSIDKDAKSLEEDSKPTSAVKALFDTEG